MMNDRLPPIIRAPRRSPRCQTPRKLTAMRTMTPTKAVSVAIRQVLLTPSANAMLFSPGQHDVAECRYLRIEKAEWEK